jgi:hypothetical protein
MHQKMITGFLMCSLMLSSAIFVSPQKAQALDAVVVTGGNGTVQETMTAASSMVQQGLMYSLQIKEFSLDAIAWGLINIVVKEMIRSTTQWVNSGFQGSPAFVTNLEGFLTDIADKVAGNFIYGAGLNFICSPFKLNLQLALDFQYRTTRTGGYQAQCRLSTSVANIERFLDGDFTAGGWDAWFNTALVEDNNPYTAMYKAQTGLYSSISNAQGKEVKMLDFGRGFMSKRVCKENTKPGESAMAQAAAGSDCSVVTPGAVIESQLNSSLNLPAQRLAVADEINELVGALLSQLTKQALGSAFGMLGLTSSYEGQQSYFDRVVDERDTKGFTSTNNTPVQSAISTEIKYLNYQKQMYSLLVDASNQKSSCDQDIDRRPTLPNTLVQKLLALQTQVAATGKMVAELDRLNTDYILTQTLTTPTSTIQSLYTRYQASSTPVVQANILNQFLAIQSSGLLHTIQDIVIIETTTLPVLQTEVQGFLASLESTCRSGNDGAR